MKMIHLSFRRYFLDFYLAQQNFSGDVIDVGGKKANTRGDFKPPLEDVKSWKFCNIDPSVEPDYLCSATNIPVADSSFDYGLICEVIEHLETPEVVLKESFRILKKGATLAGSIPFMYPKHADPFDYQRWTDNKLREELKKAGFTNIKVNFMGGTLAVVWDMIRIKFEGGGVINRLARLQLKLVSIFIINYYKKRPNKKFNNTSGFFFTAIKP